MYILLRRNRPFPFHPSRTVEPIVGDNEGTACPWLHFTLAMEFSEDPAYYYFFPSEHMQKINEGLLFITFTYMITSTLFRYLTYYSPRYLWSFYLNLSILSCTFSPISSHIPCPICLLRYRQPVPLIKLVPIKRDKGKKKMWTWSVSP
jgi:hypothetical protein